MTKTERHDRITKVFLEACGLASDQRGTFLDKQCGDDADLRAEIEAMLAAEDRTPGTLEAPALGPGFRLSWTSGQATSLAEPPPEKVADYKILDVVGEGGMGVVYRAEQDSPRRVVALKVIKPGLATPKMLKRFEHEAAILGRLQHPGIAQIFEAGIADSGAGPQPFFAMEFIKGQPLTKFADDHDLGTRERLSLFTKVCDALQHAHQKGVIHRDLKPGNILVDSSGQPKILDFGVARAIDLDIQTTTLRTDVAQPIGTLPYMSPEQTTGDADQLDTRSDVYALGVLAYELLAGRLPYDVSRKMVHEAVRIIREEDPTPLSAVNKVFRGDLETIVAKALEKDTQRRYQSASDFAADIHRYLKDEPIVARPPSSMYLLRKFARRNRAFVAGAGAVLVIMAVSLMGITAALQEARQQRHVAEHQRDRALEAEKEARAQSTFLSDILMQASPDVGANSSIELREVLELAANRLDQAAYPPRVEASLRHTLGQTYVSLREFDKAEVHLLRERELLSSTLEPNHPRMLENAHHLAHAYIEQVRLKEAAPLLAASLEHYRATQGDDSIKTLSLMNSYANYYSQLRQGDKAEALFLATLDGVRRIRSETHPLALICKARLGLMYRLKKRYAESEEMLRQTLEGRRGRLGGEHKDTLTAMNNLGALYSDMRRYADAVPLFREALEGQRRIWGMDHYETLICQINLVRACFNNKLYDEAEKHCTDLLPRARATFGETDNNMTLVTMRNLARIYWSKKRHDEAASVYAELLPLAEEHATRRMLGMILTDRGIHLTRIGDFEQAEQDLLKSHDIFNRELGTDNRLTIGSLATLYEVWNKPEAAAEWRAKLPDPDHGTSSP